MKILNSEKKYHGHVFDVAKVKCELPDGRERFYDLVEHGPAVVLVPVTEEGKILFVKQYRLGSQKELLELPAGMINEGEDPDPAAERELQEETGYESLDIIKLGGFYASAGYCSEYLNIYLARNLKWNPLPQDDDEFLSNISMTVNEAYEAVWKGEIEDAKTIAGLMMAYQYLHSS